ncbi:MAG: hypothetical protein AB7P04_08625 [Bacteriovoracia bacterium]
MEFKPLHRKNGFATLTILGILGSLCLAAGVLLTRIDSSSFGAAHGLAQSQTDNYTAGLTSVIVGLVNQYLRTTALPTHAGMQQYVMDRLPGLVTDGYVLQRWTLGDIGDPTFGVINSGPFTGMSGTMYDIFFWLEVRKQNTGAISKIYQRGLLAQISMLQYLVFSNGPADLITGASSSLYGRIHINGKICLAESGGNPYVLRLDMLEASGQIYHDAHPECQFELNPGNLRNNQTFVAFSTVGPDAPAQPFIDPPSSSANIRPLNYGLDSGCTNCGSTGLNWRDYALATWHGHLRSDVHGVIPLRLPVEGSAAAQAGANTRTPGSLAQNINNVRFLVDPVVPGEDVAVRNQKLAFKSDIRIINGVWYVRDKDDDNAWPGVPIWSDHPGNYLSPAGEEAGIVEPNLAIGQTNIRANRAWSGTPTGYSFYSADTTGRLLGNTSGVVSYGNLFFQAGTGWVPGGWLSGNGTNTSLNSGLCAPPTSTCAGFCTTSGLRSAVAPVANFCPSAPTALDVTTQLLNATRSGFRDGHAGMVGNPASARETKSRVLPINFNVRDFAAALRNFNNGELGTYFDPNPNGNSKNLGRPFNGIIYITSTWPGSLKAASFSQSTPGGLAPATAWADPIPVIWNTAIDGPAPTTQPQGAHVVQHRLLPYPLCSGNLGGQTFDAGGGVFKIPDCAHYVTGSTRNVRPNALRIFNASPVGRSDFPVGLTIATNLPAYIMGDFNATSVPRPAGNVQWLPMLVAADQATFLSNNWRDDNSLWNYDLGNEGAWSNRVASNTTYNLAIIAGWAATSFREGPTPAFSGGGIANFPRFLENWSSSDMNFNGSFVIGFNSVFSNHGRFCCDKRTYNPPNRRWNHDPNYELSANQPPGLPQYTAFAVTEERRM